MLPQPGSCKVNEILLHSLPLHSLPLHPLPLHFPSLALYAMDRVLEDMMKMIARTSFNDSAMIC